MTLHVGTQLLFLVWSYDFFYDTTLANENERRHINLINLVLNVCFESYRYYYVPKKIPIHFALE